MKIHLDSRELELGIFFLLKTSWHLLEPYLCSVSRSCISMSAVPKQWRNQFSSFFFFLGKA